MSSINGGRRCAACKYLRRRCSESCVLAPFFPPSNPYRFACVHKVFGASNVARMLQGLGGHERADAADAMAWEAYWRVQDPVYGSSAIVAHLQREIRGAQNELATARAQIALLRESQKEGEGRPWPGPGPGQGRWGLGDDAAFLLPEPSHWPSVADERAYDF